MDDSSWSQIWKSKKVHRSQKSIPPRVHSFQGYKAENISTEPDNGLMVRSSFQPLPSFGPWQQGMKLVYQEFHTLVCTHIHKYNLILLIYFSPCLHRLILLVSPIGSYLKYILNLIFFFLTSYFHIQNYIIYHLSLPDNPIIPSFFIPFYLLLSPMYKPHESKDLT